MRCGGSGRISKPHHEELEPRQDWNDPGRKEALYKIGKVREALQLNQEEPEKYQRVATDLGRCRRGYYGDGTEDVFQGPFPGRCFDEDNELTHLDLLREHGMNQEDLVAQEQEREFQQERISGAMKCLSDKEVYVIRNRVIADQPLTLQEIGNHLNLSKERVRQIESQALRKLRKEMSEHGTHPRPESSLSHYPIPTRKTPWRFPFNTKQSSSKTLSLAP